MPHESMINYTQSIVSLFIGVLGSLLAFLGFMGKLQTKESCGISHAERDKLDAANALTIEQTFKTFEAKQNAIHTEAKATNLLLQKMADDFYEPVTGRKR